MNIPVDDRGLAYGDGVFETIRLTGSVAPLALRHKTRMAKAAAMLGIPFVPSEFDRQLAALLAEGVAGVGKLILTRGSGGRGYGEPASVRPRWIRQRFDLPVCAPAIRKQGMVLGLCQGVVSDAPHLAGLKHLNRLDQVLARRMVSASGWDEGLLLDQHGRPLELTSMNLFARFGDTLWTPSLLRAGVAGVARDWCLEYAAQLSLNTSVRTGLLTRMCEADEVFACNSVAGVVPVRKLATWQWPVGQTTQRFQTAFEALFH